METVTLNIHGMTCNGCVKSVDNVLRTIDGIERVEVSLANANALIAYNAEKTNPAVFKKAIEAAGFETA